MVRKGETPLWLFSKAFFAPFYATQTEILECMTVYANNAPDSQMSLLISSGIITPGITFLQVSSD